MKIILSHRDDGGTGITNFPPQHLPVYEAALARCKREDIVICSKPLQVSNVFYLQECHSLHCTNERDLTDFWKIFEEEKTRHNLKLE